MSEVTYDCPEFELEITSLSPQSDKVRILTCSDDPRSHTGFGGVHRNIVHNLRQVKDFQVVSVGWYPPRDHRTETKKNANDGLLLPNETDWTIIPCNPMVTDVCGRTTTGKVIHVFDPNVIITIGDPWNVDALVQARKVSSTFVWIAYVPIDGFPLDKKWAEVLDRADHIVAYGSWGHQIIKEALPHRKPDTLHKINHGTSPDHFFPIPKDKEELKAEIGFNGVPFLVGWIARNTARKRLDLALEAFGRFVAASITCPTCGYVRLQGFDPEIPDNVILDDETKVRCQECDSQCIVNPKKTDAFIYLHFGTDEPSGYNVNSLVNAFKINGLIKYAADIRVGAGVSTSGLNKIYNIMDVTFNTAEAEGWGMPIHESMACKVPVVVPNFGGYLQDLVTFDLKNNKINAFVADNKCLTRDKETNYQRALPDPANFAFYFDYLYHWKNQTMKDFFIKYNVPMDSFWRTFYLEDRLEVMIQDAYIRAITLNWQDIGEQWVDLVKAVAPPLQKKEIINYLLDWKEDKSVVFSMADSSEPYDINSYGPEITFYQAMKTLGKDFKSVIVGYAKGNEGHVECKMNELFIPEPDFKAISTNYHLNGSKAYVENLDPKLIISHGSTLLEAARLAEQHKKPLISFIYQWSGACGNQLRMSECKLNCSSCSSFMNNQHLSYYDPYMKALSQCEAIGFPSEYMRRLFLKQWATFFDPDATFVLYPEVNPKNYLFIDRGDDSTVKIEREYISLMRGTEEKGSLIFILLAKLMPEQKFLMVEPSDKATVEAVRNIPNILVVNKTEMPYMYYRMSKLVLIPSIWHEPFSRVSVEATLSGVPVLASDIEGLALTVCPSARIERYNIKGWIDTIQAVLNKPAFHKKVMTENNKLIEKYYDQLKIQQAAFVKMVRGFLG